MDRVSGAHGHVPVMAYRIRELLAPAILADSDGPAVHVDATLGAGGHAEVMLTSFPELRLIGVDRDASALDIARERLSHFGDRVTLVQARYDEIPEALDSLGLSEITTALFDLGVSSMQLDRAERGFAYAVDAPLDMRMNADDPLTAAEILNTYSHGEIARVLSEYGEERFAGRIASAIVREREREPFTTSGRLVELLYASIPAAARRTGGHPAKRTFQALRIEVNDELGSLRRAIPAAAEALSVGGRIAVMSYQSLEDRIVKREFAERLRSTSPPGLPVELPGTEPEFRAVTRGAELASPEEVEQNPRSAPVRVRVVERTRRRSQA
ncbi:16S rRNA (cytosine(1402)-N(4))-methyltransferase RsmH [Gordonia jinhuaensis]|uniref:Ribosomal RNA small subunit methyltransferase H n=1 Tax=Gordonia jinhuaensis TaxID=1517702 RepID=A0A916WPW8_9ACTN|nr:16S rRNA (cytosine(1402)-N(4))-methyltransferase RsmH [Gordonia jinhuaensis]GGB19222.1 ribosomal RNA small subunit methyltransferase H [Gordonia jinhuaensis]